MKHVSKEGFDFNKIYKELWPQVYRFIYYKVQNAEEAEELTQDVFQKVYRQGNKGVISEEKIRAYTFTAARNTVYDLWRGKSRRPKVIQLTELNEASGALIDGNEASESNLIVEEALNTLPEEDRHILKLRIIEGYTVNEVANLLKMPPGTVKSKQFRALQKLKEKLIKGGYFDE